MTSFPIGRVLGVSMLLAMATVPLNAQKKAKVQNLAACPAWGAEQRGSTRGVLNVVKHHVPESTTPIVLTFDDIPVLQKQADAVVKSGPRAKVLAKDRAKLGNFTVGDKHVGEGDLVSMVGFLVGKASANVGESANCYLRGQANNDFEIRFAQKAHTSEKDAIVAEMIPQNRPKEWTLAALRGLANDGRQILIIGQLMFDSHHKIGDSPRFSLWEVHPTTRLLVCQRPDNNCDPAVADQWKPL
jgi:hypothetical protein